LFSFTSSKPSCTAVYPSVSSVLTCVTKQGPAWMIVTGVTTPLSSKTWLMPSLMPSNPFTITSRDCQQPGLYCIIPFRELLSVFQFQLDRNFNIHTCGQVQPHQRINRFGIWINHINQTFVCPDL